MALTLPPILRKTNISVLLFVLFIVLLISWMISHVFISARQAERTRLFVINTDDVASITIEAKDVKTVIVRSSGTYVFRSPYDGKPADPHKVRAYCDALAQLPIIRRIGTFEVDASSPFGITPSSARVTIEHGRQIAEAILGRNSPVADQCYVYLPSRKTVVLTQLFARQLLEFPPEQFRDNQLLAFKPTDVVAIDVKRPSSGISLNKVDNVWMMREDPSGKTYVCDTRAVVDLATALSSVAIDDFTPADKNFTIASCGLDTPRVAFTVTASSGTRLGGALGSFYGDKRVYAARDGAVAGGVSAQWVTILSTQTTAYLRTYIIDFAPGRIASFIRTVNDETDIYDKERGKWFRTAKIRRPYDLEKMNMFLFYLSALKAERVFDENNLGAVTAEYIFRDKDGTPLLKLQIGDEQDTYTKVRINGRGAVMGVQSDIARLLVL